MKLTIPPPILQQQKGFTLVEIAIVVLLAGVLLTAGLLVGRGQMGKAQAQEAVKIANDLQSAAREFRQRFSYLPGDWVFVANTIPNIGAGGTGGVLGNGLITGTLNATTGVATAASEIGQAPVQLYQAGLIGKLGADSTRRIQTQYGPVQMAGAVANTGGSLPAYTAQNPTVLNVIIFFNLPCEIVLEVDRALDNGDPQSGKVMTDAVCNPGGFAVRTFVPL